MKTLYPGIANSPIVQLSADISAAATTIPLTSASDVNLPPAPNLATIGEDEGAETILFTGKSGNSLTGVIRGFDGTTAQAWTLGKKVARRFTNYDYSAILERLTEAASIPAPIQQGVNIIETTQATGVELAVKGRTLVNIPGKDGGCESLAPFTISGPVSVTLSTSQVKSGSNSIKIAASAQNSYFYKDYTYPLDATKQYIIGCWVFIESYTGGAIGFRVRDVGTDVTRYAVSANSSLLGQWQFIYIKIPKSNALVGSGFRLLFGSNSSGTHTAYFDEIRLYELSDADSTAIGTTIVGEDIDRYWPYVDSVQHTQGVSVRKTGKNLFSPFSERSLTSGGSNTLNVIEPYVLNFTSATTNSNGYVTYDVLPNTNYVFSCDCGDNGQIGVFDTNPNINISEYSRTSPRAFNSGNRTQVRLYFRMNTAGEARFSYPQLELGTAATSFEPRHDEYMNVPTVIASNVDRTICDSYDSATGQVFRRWGRIVFTGNENWQYRNDNGEYITVSLEIGSPSPYKKSLGALNFYVHYLDSEVWPSVGQISIATSAYLNSKLATLYGSSTSEVGTIYVNVLKSDLPSQNAAGVKTYLQNKATAGTPLALDYVLATPVTEQLTGDLGGLSLDNGGNTIEVLSGVVVREKANPKLLAPNYYVINALTIPESLLSHRTNAVLKVYRGTDVDDKWVFFAGDSNYYGGGRLRIPVADYDPTATYFVDYIVLDKYAYTTSVVDATLTYQSSLGSVVAKLAQNVARLKTIEGVQDFALDYIQAMAHNNEIDLAALTSRVGYVEDQLAITAGDAITALGLIGDMSSVPTASKEVAGAITELFQSASNGKSAVAAAITGMGQAASGSDTYAQLASKIGNISKDADAAAGDVLAGKTYYQGGLKRTGTMVKRGVVAAAANDRSGTTLRLRPPVGYYDGTSAALVTLTDANYIAANLPKNISLFGLTGDLEIPGITWTEINPGDNQYYNSVCYGNGLFVAVGGSYIMTSPDGVTWTVRNSGGYSGLNSVCYGNGIFVIVGNSGSATQPNGVVLTSTDGITWTFRSNPNGPWIRVCYGNGTFVATSESRGVYTSSQLMSSTNGTTWTARTPPVNCNWPALCYGNGMFIAGGEWTSTRAIITSTDGITWTERTFPSASNGITAVCWGKDRFVAISSTPNTGVGIIMVSFDGVTWAVHDGPHYTLAREWGAICYGYGLFVSVASYSVSGYSQVMTSTDGINWTLRKEAIKNLWNSICYGNGKFVAVSRSSSGNRVMTSGMLA